MKQCKHCKQIFAIVDKPKGWMANHSRWCDANPKRVEYASALAKARAGKTEEGSRIAAEKIAEHHRKGTYDLAKEMQRANPSFKGRSHATESVDKMRKAALQSDHRRLKKGVVSYRGVVLDSSWELELAKRLDEMGVLWNRPSPLKWVDGDGNQHNYFPDFYLPEYDVYLDPKNPYALCVQRKKIDIISKTYPNVIWLKSLVECQQYAPIVKGI
jgi:hypothetical protein